MIQADNNYIYLCFGRRPIYILNLISNEVNQIGIVGEAPGEYNITSWIGEYDGNFYIIDHSNNRIELYNKDFTFLNDITCNVRGKTKFINDSLVFYNNFTSLKDFFILFDIKNKKKINSFGDLLCYPIIQDRNKLYNEGRLKPNLLDWDVKDSLLIWYDYYNDHIRAYNIYTGELIKIFGKEHNGWSVPKVFESSGDQYHEKRYRVSWSPSHGVLITNKYIYVSLNKIWEVGWGVDKNIIKQLIANMREKDIITNKFIFIDIYSRENFNYIGSFYPLDDYLYNETGRIDLKFIDSVDDNIINFYLSDLESMFFRKVSIMVDFSDTLEN